MPRPTRVLAQEYRARLRKLNGARKRADTLLAKKLINRSDVELLYEAAYIASVTAFETLVEELFIGLLVGGLISADRSLYPRVQFKSHRVAREVVQSGRRYADWLPYDRTIDRAEVFFRGGRPFTRLDSDDKRLLESCLAIRHAIAHRSRYALGNFERKVLHGLTLAPRERTPAGLLRSQFSKSPQQSRYENLVTQLHRLAAKICH